MALRTVPWLTLKRAARSSSLGMASPGFHTPACNSRVIRPLICWYSGLKAGPAGAASAASGVTVEVGWGTAEDMVLHCSTKPPIQSTNC